MEQVTGPQNSLEQVLQTCGYKFKETVQITDRQIQVYEKPQNPKYEITTEQPKDSLQQDITDLLKILNRSLILVDGFDKDHDARRIWGGELQKQNPESSNIYDKLEKQSRLKINRVYDVYAILESILDNTENQELKLKLTELYKKLRNLATFKNYLLLSLGEKVLYMEEVDKIVTQVIDLLR